MSSRIWVVKSSISEKGMHARGKRQEGQENRRVGSGYECIPIWH
ncbi:MULTISPECIES: hypothetical protein [unclassified Moorena]|nr:MULTISPECIES: hypothetical protein [unclassified Moorena]